LEGDQAVARTLPTHWTTQQHKHGINAHTDIQVSSGIRNQDPSVRGAKTPLDRVVTVIGQSSITFLKISKLVYAYFVSHGSCLLEVSPSLFRWRLQEKRAQSLNTEEGDGYNTWVHIPSHCRSLIPRFVRQHQVLSNFIKIVPL
jgi:hypothetical protein